MGLLTGLVATGRAAEQTALQTHSMYRYKKCPLERNRCAVMHTELDGYVSARATCQAQLPIPGLFRGLTMALPTQEFSLSVVWYIEAKKHVLHAWNPAMTQTGCGSVTARMSFRI